MRMGRVVIILKLKENLKNIISWKNIYKFNKKRIFSLKKKEALYIISKTLNNFKFNFKAILYFEICYRLLVAFIFIPLNYFIINNFMKSEGVYALTNKDFLKFGLTPVGMICIVLLVLISFCVIFVEISVLTYIGYMSHKKEKVTLIEGVFNSVSVLPRVIGRGMIELFLITAIIGPLIGVGLCSSLIKELTIPPFITIELSKTISGKLLYAAFIFILAILLFRWVLAIPEIVIENKTGRQCLKDSKVLYKKNKLAIFSYMSVWVIVNLTIVVLIISIFTTIEAVLANIFGESIIFLILGGITLVLFYVSYIVVSLIMMPLFISFLIEIYYKIRKYRVEERDFSTHEDYKGNRIYNFSKKWSRVYLMSSLCVFIIFTGVRGFNVVFDKVIQKNVQVTAHRGSSLKAPENSISSIRFAIEEKADFAEIDVQTTKDNVVVLFHDTNLKRIAKNNSDIKDLTYEEISKMDIGSYFSPDFAGERIPTLESVLQEAKGKIKLNIELKPMKDNDPLPVEVVDLIRKYNMEDEVVITSLDYNMLQQVKEDDPRLKVGYNIVAAIGNIGELNVDFVSVESSLAKPNLIYTMHGMGKEVYAWTVNDEEEAQRMLAIGVDNIITDNVALINDGKNIMDWEEKDHLTFYIESILNIAKYAKI